MAHFGRDYRSVERSLTDAAAQHQRDITISYKEIHALPRFTNTITNLTLRGLPLGEVNRLPANLQYLTILDCPIQRFTCEFPKTLKWIHINGTFLKELPALPPGLEHLSIHYADLQRLPELPPTLKSLHVIRAPLRELPTLPPRLAELRLDSLSRIGVIPPLPPTLWTLCMTELPIHELPEGYEHLTKKHPYGCIVVRNCPYLPPQKESESSVVYALRLWDMQEREAMARAADRARAIHEELASVVWRPARIAAALEAGIEPEDL